MRQDDQELLLSLPGKDQPQSFQMEALDQVLGHMDGLLLTSQWERVEAILMEVKPQELSLIISLAFLAILRGCELVAFEQYADRVVDHVVRTDPKRVEELLKGLVTEGQLCRAKVEALTRDGKLKLSIAVKV